MRVEVWKSMGRKWDRNRERKKNEENVCVWVTLSVCVCVFKRDFHSIIVNCWTVQAAPSPSPKQGQMIRSDLLTTNDKVHKSRDRFFYPRPTSFRNAWTFLPCSRHLFVPFVVHRHLSCYDWKGAEFERGTRPTQNDSTDFSNTIPVACTAGSILDTRSTSAWM